MRQASGERFPANVENVGTDAVRLPERFGTVRKLVSIGTLSIMMLTGCTSGQPSESPQLGYTRPTDDAPTEDTESSERERPYDVPDSFPDLPLPEAEYLDFAPFFRGYQVSALAEDPDAVGLQLVNELEGSGFTIVDEIDDPTGDLYRWYLEGPGWEICVASRITDLLYTVEELD